MDQMIPFLRALMIVGLPAALALPTSAQTPAQPYILAPAPGTTASTPPAKPLGPAACLATGDGYLRAHLAGAIDARIDWPNSGTHCEGDSRDKPLGVTLSFQRMPAAATNLLFVFGISGVREGKPAHAAGVNLTVFVQGTSHIYGTLGDSRCTVDSLTQRPLTAKGTYRLEARGFCTQPAHAVRGDGALLVSTFEFAGVVSYDAARN
jgi:hypothetical protein